MGGENGGGDEKEETRDHMRKRGARIRTHSLKSIRISSHLVSAVVEKQRHLDPPKMIG